MKKLIFFTSLIISILGGTLELRANSESTVCASGDGDAAINACDSLIKKNPKDANAFQNRGFVNHRKGFYDDAIADYTEALRLDPSNVIAKARLQFARGNKDFAGTGGESLTKDQEWLFLYAEGLTDQIRVHYESGKLDAGLDTLTFTLRVENFSADRVRLGEFVERQYRFLNKLVFQTEPIWPQSLKNMSLEIVRETSDVRPVVTLGYGSTVPGGSDVIEPNGSTIIRITINRIAKSFQNIIMSDKELNGVLCFFSPVGLRYIAPFSGDISIDKPAPSSAENVQSVIPVKSDADNTSLLIAVGFAVIGGIVIGSRFTTKKSKTQSADATNQQQEREKEQREREKREREQQDRDRREKAEHEQAQHERNKREQERRAQEAREQAQREQEQRDRQEREQREKAQQERAQREQEQRDKSQREERAKETKRPWHQVLEVPSTATWDEIRAAYRKMIAMYHPDKVGSLGKELQELAERKSKEINEAFNAAERLKKPQK